MEHFLDEAAQALGKKKPTPAPELFTLLKTYAYPGNIRELQSMIIDAVTRHKSGVLSLEAFRAHIGRNQSKNAGQANQPPADTKKSPPVIYPGPELPTIKEATDLLVREAMQRANGNQSIAAGMLGISQQALSKRLKKKSEE